MSFWSLGRRRKEPERPPAAAVEQAVTRLAVVEFWTSEQRLTVGMDLSTGRLTDQVNSEESVRVVALDVAPEDRSQPVEMRPDQEWADLVVMEALLVFPPPQLTDSHRRLHRPKQPIDIEIGPFEISGFVHVPPGAQAAGFLFRQNTRFAPVTRASVRDTGLPGFEQRAEVVLVNLRRVKTIRDVSVREPDEPELPASPGVSTPDA